MIRVKATIKYDGSRFFGFAKQPNKVTVTDSLQEVFKNINEYSKITGSGRTDKAVHATGQVFHIDISLHWKTKLDYLKNILNSSLKHIEIIKLELVNRDFHARFSAKKRVYRYICCRYKTVFTNSYFAYKPYLDTKKISQAISLFNGIHDFSMFSKQDKQIKNKNKIIYNTKFYEYKEFYIFKMVANSFLRSQVRLMVEFLINISDKKLTNQDLTKQLQNQKRFITKPASANGLYLCKVVY